MKGNNIKILQNLEVSLRNEVATNIAKGVVALK